MQNTGDTADYRAMSPECRPLPRSTPTQVEGIYDAGGYVKTDGWSINVDRSVSRPGANGRVTVTIDVELGTH